MKFCASGTHWRHILGNSKDEWISRSLQSYQASFPKVKWFPPKILSLTQSPQMSCGLHLTEGVNRSVCHPGNLYLHALWFQVCVLSSLPFQLTSMGVTELEALSFSKDILISLKHYILCTNSKMLQKALKIEEESNE